MRGLRLLPLILLLATACGPVPDLLIGVRSLVLPIVLSAPRPSPLPAPAPSITFAPLPSGSSLGPVLGPLPLPPPTAACPDAGPLTFPAVAATQIVGGGAPPGTYPYRASVEQQGTSVTVGESRIVHDAQSANGTYTFQETISGGPQDGNTYGYEADTSKVALASIKFADGSSFHPVTPVMLLQTPADPTAGGWSSAGADPLSGISMTYQAQGVTGRKRVNACGELVDAWEVHATATLVEPARGEKVDETLTYDFATQYGGLIVQELIQSTFAGLTSGTTQEAAAIDAVP